MNTPGTDPKGAIGATKTQLHLIPPAATEECAKVLRLGMEKYGERNWLYCEDGVLMTTYLSATLRHFNCILEGDDIDEESKAHHLGHIMANCAIMLDARKHGTLVDNRKLPQNHRDGPQHIVDTWEVGNNWKLPEPPPGRKWHRDDWAEKDLPDGWRPVLMGEKIQRGDMLYMPGCGWMLTEANIGMYPDTRKDSQSFFRTQRPLPQEEHIPVEACQHCGQPLFMPGPKCDHCRPH